MKLSRSDYRRARFYRLLAFKRSSNNNVHSHNLLTTYYLTNTNCSSLRQTDILGICKITLTKACKMFILIEEFA